MDLVTGEKQVAAQALADVLKPSVAPMAILTGERPIQILVIRPRHQTACPALWAHQLPGLLEILDRTDMSASQVMNEPVLAEVDRTAVCATLPKSGYGVTRRANLNPIDDHFLQYADVRPFPQNFLRRAPT